MTTTNESYSHLFAPLRVNHLTLRNRVVMPPMVTNFGVTTERSRAWYAERARGGVGLIIVEATRLPFFDQPGFALGLRALAEAVHAEGATIAIQLFAPPQVNGEPVEVTGSETARGITREEIRALIDRFAEVAKVVQEAGFDAVEPHGAHGFFLNQFFSPRFNQREDEYGGDLVGRMRLGCEIVRRIREAVGPDYLILYRHTPEERAAGGYTLEESQTFAQELVRAGVNVLDISPSTEPDGEHAGLAAAIKSCVDVPVIAVGGMNDPEAAEAALRAGKCDLVAIGRGLIADPYWPEKVFSGRRAEIVACVECNEGCFGNLRQGVPIGCTQNPRAGLEYQEA
ncbi:MAG TPA: NADH:flavin oxidoreductase [Armatimonadetes bacterium]|nr:NADH:flavin oxidoreductase [Armatimonadota bacterium]